MTEPRHALVVGVASYDDPQLTRLRAPGLDATAFAHVLDDPDRGGFAVTTAADPDARGLRLAISDFLSARRSDDLVVVYLSCHGIRDARGRLHFAAADTRPAQLAATGVAAAWLVDQLDECAAKRQVLILDCCFSGAFATGAKGDEVLVALRTHGRGRMILTASRASEYSFEGAPLTDGAPSGSVFTTGLVEGLRTGAADVRRRGYVTVAEAYDYAFDHVARNGAGQTPQLFAERVEGTLVLARNPDVAEPETPPLSRPSPIPTTRSNPTLNASLRVPAFTNFGRGRLISLSADGGRIAISGPTGITEYSLGDSSSRVLRLTSTVNALAYDDDTVVAVASDGRGWSRYRFGRTGEPEVLQLNTIPSINAYAIAIDPTATMLAFADERSLRIVRLADGTAQVVASASPVSPVVGIDPVRVAVSAGGRYVAQFNGESGVRIVDVASQDVVRMVDSGEVDAIALSSDGQALAVGRGGRVAVWDLTTTTTVGDEIDVGESVRHLAFAPDHSYLVATTADGAVVWWNRLGRSYLTLARHAGQCTTIAIAEGWFASAGPDREVHLWRV